MCSKVGHRLGTLVFVRLKASLGGVKVVERFFHLPLDYKEPDGEKIRVFARSMIPTDKAKTPEEEDKLPICRFHLLSSSSITDATIDMPVLYLQGTACAPLFVPYTDYSGKRRRTGSRSPTVRYQWLYGRGPSSTNHGVQNPDSL